MFSSNATPAKEFEYARELGAIINLGDITHIDFLEQHGGIPETISCRYNPGGVFKMSNGIMDNPGDAKYGLTTEQMFEAFRILKQKGAKHFGIHAFLASNTVTNEYYPALAKVLFELAVKLKEETGADIKFINLSGGVGIPYRPDRSRTISLPSARACVRFMRRFWYRQAWVMSPCVLRWDDLSLPVRRSDYDSDS